MTEAFRRFFDFLAGLGLIVRDDPPKTIIPDARTWGRPVNGLALSAECVPIEHPGSFPDISIVLRNFSSTPSTLLVPSWLFFYSIEITETDGKPVPLTAYGRELLNPERSAETRVITLEPGGLTEAQIPIGAIYAIRMNTRYHVTVTCDVPPDSSVLRSNSVII